MRYKIYIIPIVLLMFLSCIFPNKSNFGKRDEPQGNVSITIQLEKSEVRLNEEPISAIITLKNIGKKPIRVQKRLQLGYKNYGNREIYLEIFDKQGRECFVSKPTSYISSIFDYQKLMPGDSLTVGYRIQKWYTYLDNKEGEYKIRVVYDPEGEEALSPEVFGAKAYSPWVKLKVIGDAKTNKSLVVTREIDSPDFNSKLFADTVIFELNNQVIKAVKEKEKKENWEKVKAIFQKRSNMDFTVDDYSIKGDIIDPFDKTHKITLKKSGLDGYYELRSQFHYVYIIGINKQGKVALVQQLMYHYPANYPPVPED
jgi:hypothetical protein